MKKIWLASFFLVLLSASVLAFQPAAAPYGIGARYGAMGGAGSALATDLSCAYYNPAGIASSGLFELKVGLGGATDGLNEIYKIISTAGDPEKFLSQNFLSTFDLNGNINAILGINLNGVGLSAVSVGNLALLKPTAGTLVGSSATGMFATEGIATLARRFSTPFLPIASLDAGINIKSVSSFTLSSTATGIINSQEQVIKGSGIGFDIGARGKVNSPLFPVAVAVVIRDLGETMKNKVTTKATTYNPLNGDIVSQTSTDTDGADTTTPTTLTLGVATTLPGIGLSLAMDLDSVSGSQTYSVTHLGIEYPILLHTLTLRGGLVSGGPGGNISMTTMGISVLGINYAVMIDSKNSKNNSSMLDFSFAL